MNKIMALLATLLISSLAHAYSLNTNLFYFSDAFSVSSTDTINTQTFYDLDFMIRLDKRGSFNVGWSYASQSMVASGSSETSYSLTEMGPRFSYFIDKAKTWVTSFTYYLQSNADYTSSSTTLEWRGSNMRLQFGYLQEVTSSFLIGVNLNYHTASYSEQFTSSGTFSDVSNTRTILYPTMQFTYRGD